MSSIKLLFTLNSEELGYLKLRDNPIGWDAVKFSILRDPIYKGVKREFSSFDLQFIKAGKNYIQQMYEQKGIEASIFVKVYEYNPNLYRWEEFFSGKINLEKYIVTETTVNVNIKQDDFTDRFINLEDTLVDVMTTTDINGAPIAPFISVVESINLHSKSIVKSLHQKNTAFYHEEVYEDTHISAGVNTVDRDYIKYMQFELSDEPIKEIDESFTYPAGWNNDIPGEFFKAGEAGVLNIEFRVNFLAWIGAWKDDGVDPRISGCNRGDGTIGYYIVRLVLLHRDKDNATKNYWNIREWAQVGGCGLYSSMPTSYIQDVSHSQNDIVAEVGDKFHLYVHCEVGGDYVERATGGTDLRFFFEGKQLFNENESLNYIKVNNLTTVPATPCLGLLKHEIYSRWAQYVFGKNIAFYSDYFGRTDSQPINYSFDGEGSLEFHTNGFNIRGFNISDKSIFASFKSLFEFDSSRHCLGASIELMEGQVGQPLKNGNFDNGLTDWEYTSFPELIDWVDEGGIISITKGVKQQSQLLWQGYNFEISKTYVLDYKFNSENAGPTTNIKLYAANALGLDGVLIGHIFPLLEGKLSFSLPAEKTNLFIYGEFDLSDPVDAKIIIDELKISVDPFTENVLRVEKLEYFFKREIILDLGCVGSVKKSVAREYFYNALGFGYQQWKNEELNNLDEFNAFHKYITPLTVVKNELNKITPEFIASGYSLEFTRREQYSQTSTTDTKSDNSNFVICVRRDGADFETERNQDCTVTGVIDPSTIYNVRRSPKRSFYKWGQVIKSSLLKQLDKYIKFSFAEGNYNMTSQFTGETSPIIEKADVLISTLPDPIWINEFYEFETELTREQIQIIRGNPYGIIKFKDCLDNEMQGFIDQIKIDRAENTAEFKLLRVYNPV